MKLTPVAITASGTYSGYSVWNVNDGDPNTFWNSGGWATQYIQIDLGRPMPVQKIRLQVAQDRTGSSAGTISVGSSATSLTNVYSWNQATADYSWLEFSGDSGSYHGGDVRYIRITTTSSPAWICWREIEVYGGPEYFGYFRDSAYDVGPNPGCAATNSCDFMSQTVAHGANLVWIGATSTTDLANRLAETQTLGARAVVDLQYLGVWSGGAPVLTAWNNVKAVVSGYGTTVVAFYLYDEPYYNGITPANLTTLAGWVHTAFPNAATASIMDASSVMTTSFNSSYVSMFDWVGFDCYRAWTSNWCDRTTLSTMPQVIAKLRGTLNGAQRMIAVPAAAANWGSDFVDTQTSTQSQLISSNLNPWQKEILGDAKYIAIVPWEWQTYPGVVAGAQDIPRYSARLYELAYSFLNLSHGDMRLFADNWWASQSTSDTLPFDAGDFNTNTSWNSGNYPVQWIAADLTRGGGGPQTRVTRIDLTVLQSPSGPTTHELWGYSNTYGWLVLHTWTASTTDGQILTWPSAGDNVTAPLDITSIEVDTNSGPSWVGWREITIYR